MFFNTKAYFIIGFFYTIPILALAQNQHIADSLAKVYPTENLKDSAKMELLRNIAFNEVNDLDLAIRYSEELIDFSIAKENDLYLFRGYFLKGNKTKQKGDLDDALDAYFMAVEAGQKANYPIGEGSAYGAIASVYSISNNHETAMLYYGKAIQSLRTSNNDIILASAILNAGEAFRKNKDYDSALIYFRESGEIFERANYLTGKAYNLGNMGMVYASSDQNTLAEQFINEAIFILEKSEDYYPVCTYLIAMSDIYLEKNEPTAALAYAERSLQLAQDNQLKQQISEANLKLSELFELAGDYQASFKFYKSFVAFRDSVNNIDLVQKMADLRADYEISQKQVEVDLLHQQQRNQQIIQIGAILLFFIITSGLTFSIWQKKRSNKQLMGYNQELVKRDIEIAERNKELQEMNNSKDKLFSIIGHDLKGPLNTLTGFSTLLSQHTESLTTEDIKRLALDLDISLRNQYKLLENLLNWSLSQSGKMDFTPDVFDMNDVLIENQKLLQAQAAEKGIELNVELKEHSNVHANKKSVHTVLRNIISNAIKFTEKKGVVTMRLEHDANDVVVSVLDTGLGIGPEEQEKLFQVGSKHSTLGTANEKGTGLGLVLCKDFVEKNNGVIGVESVLGEGSKFYFTIPKAREK